MFSCHVSQSPLAMAHRCFRHPKPAGQVDRTDNKRNLPGGEGRATVTLKVYTDCFPKRAPFWAYIDFFEGKKGDIAAWGRRARTIGVPPASGGFEVVFEIERILSVFGEVFLETICSLSPKALVDEGFCGMRFEIIFELKGVGLSLNARYVTNSQGLDLTL